MIITKRKSPRRASERLKKRVYKSSTIRRNKWVISDNRKVRRISPKKIKNNSGLRKPLVRKDSLHPANQNQTSK
jgi:hypothetical protein